MDLLILLLLILLNGAFAMSEIALVSARKGRLQKLADKGDAGAAAAMALGQEPTRFLSTVQIGITAIGLLNGIYGEAALAAPLADHMVQWGMAEKTASMASTAVVVLGITYLSIVVGELVPKRLAQLSPEFFARLMARPLTLLSTLSKPFVSLLAWSTELALRILGKGDAAQEGVTEEDIFALINEGAQAGAVDAGERDMVRNVFHLDDRRVSSLMTPRSEILAFDMSKGLDDNLSKLISCEHERFPVIEGDIDSPIGVLSAKQLLSFKLNGGNDTRELGTLVCKPVFIPESWTGTQLLEFFRHSGEHLVFVVDEYGDLQGIVTHKDLLEALAGEFKDKSSTSVWSERNTDGSWTMNSMIPVLVLKDLLELESLPDEQEHGYHTLSGMLMWCFGGMPEVGNTYTWQNWQFTILSLEGNRPDKIEVRPTPINRPD
ncbi:hemolysin family protein [Shewanella corallii]|uniref:Hemolysin family protein n=1 Tax=Shewanella corallii TaxID=560080 RepID=A0ABT0N7T9_9GAMM|nr:hemolysin family protein [Shewanella corallii]MCL2914479.1 hemolysin family protein [Shewanella corallii]